MPPSQIDSDTLSEIIKGRRPHVTRHAEAYMAEYGALSFSLMTRFEILRGLKSKRAKRQLSQFERKCRESNILPITDEVIVLAADFYADLRHRGKTIDDADLLIAATAKVHHLVVVTNNTSHFHDIPDLQVDSWDTE